MKLRDISTTSYKLSKFFSALVKKKARPIRIPPFSTRIPPNPLRVYPLISYAYTPLNAVSGYNSNSSRNIA